MTRKTLNMTDENWTRLNAIATQHGVGWHTLVRGIAQGLFVLTKPTDTMADYTEEAGRSVTTKEIPFEPDPAPPVIKPPEPPSEPQPGPVQSQPTARPRKSQDRPSPVSPASASPTLFLQQAKLGERGKGNFLR